MLVVFTVKDRIKLLPYFLAYYQKIGATRFLCCLASGTGNPLYPEIEAWKGKVDLEIRPTVDDHPNVWCGPAEQGAIEAIRRTIPEPWHIIADLDEFYWLPPGMKLQDMRKMLEDGGFDASTCHLRDRISDTLRLVDPGPVLDQTYPLVCNITSLVGGCMNKVALVKSSVPIGSGHHGLVERRPTLAWGEYHHFKWLPGVLDLVVERSKNFERLGLSWYAEGLKTAALFQDGKLVSDLVMTERAPVIDI